MRSGRIGIRSIVPRLGTSSVINVYPVITRRKFESDRGRWSAFRLIFPRKVADVSVGDSEQRGNRRLVCG